MSKLGQLIPYPQDSRSLNEECISILNETNQVILSLHNKIAQLISGRVIEVKEKMQKGELSPSKLDTYPKMIELLNLVLTTIKIKTAQDWAMWDDFTTKWTSWINEEYEYVHKHLKENDLQQLEKAKELLVEIRKRIGTEYTPSNLSN